MKFKSYIDRLESPEHFYSPTGDGTIETYELKRDKKTGIETLEYVGKKDIYSEIQAWAESADISNIIQRFTNGEIDLLNKTPGSYFDATSMPKSYAEYFDKVNEAKKIFNGLPVEVRNRFDDDAEKFFLEFGTAAFNDKISDLVPDNVSKPMKNIEESYENAE